MKSNFKLHTKPWHVHAIWALLLTGCCLLGLALPPTRDLTLWMLEESHPVEMLTFLFLMIASVIGLWVTLQHHRAGHRSTALFFLLISVGFFVVGMEEAAWGQHLFGFKTPEHFKEINAQNELTLHNIGALQGRSEWFRLLFGIGGLIGVGLNRIKRFRPVSVPLQLLPWFLIILLHATVDVGDDLIDVPIRIRSAIQRSSECIEMMIGIAALLYVRTRRPSS